MTNNDNRLAVWRNDKREKSTHPHLKGNGSVNGQEFWVSAWVSGDVSEDDRRLLADILRRYESKKPFISISVQPKEARQERAQTVDPEDIPW